MSYGCRITQPQFAQYCCSARMSPWKDREGSRLSGCVRSLARSLASAIGWKLILKHRKRFDPSGGPKRGQVEANLRAVEDAAVTHAIRMRDRRGRPPWSSFRLSDGC